MPAKPDKFKASLFDSCSGARDSGLFRPPSAARQPQPLRSAECTIEPALITFQHLRIATESRRDLADMFLPSSCVSHILVHLVGIFASLFDKRRVPVGRYQLPPVSMSTLGSYSINTYPFSSVDRSISSRRKFVGGPWRLSQWSCTI